MQDVRPIFDAMAATNPVIIVEIVLTPPLDHHRGIAVEEEVNRGSYQEELDSNGILAQDELDKCFSVTLRMP